MLNTLELLLVLGICVVLPVAIIWILSWSR